MNTYECLQDEACGDGIDVIDYTFHSDRIKGLYCDGTVAIRKDMNTAQKTCTLAEELGHHHTSVGDIIDINSVQNRKQERQARLHGYNRLIGLMGIIHAFNAGCQNISTHILTKRMTEFNRKGTGKTDISTHILTKRMTHLPGNNLL